MEKIITCSDDANEACASSCRYLRARWKLFWPTLVAPKMLLKYGLGLFLLELVWRLIFLALGRSLPGSYVWSVQLPWLVILANWGTALLLPLTVIFYSATDSFNERKDIPPRRHKYNAALWGSVAQAIIGILGFVVWAIAWLVGNHRFSFLVLIVVAGLSVVVWLLCVIEALVHEDWWSALIAAIAVLATAGLTFGPSIGLDLLLAAIIILPGRWLSSHYKRWFKHLQFSLSLMKEIFGLMFKLSLEACSFLWRPKNQRHRAIRAGLLTALFVLPFDFLRGLIFQSLAWPNPTMIALSPVMLPDANTLLTLSFIALAIIGFFVSYLLDMTYSSRAYWMLGTIIAAAVIGFFFYLGSTILPVFYLFIVRVGLIALVLSSLLRGRKQILFGLISIVIGLLAFVGWVALIDLVLMLLIFTVATAVIDYLKTPSGVL